MWPRFDSQRHCVEVTARMSSAHTGLRPSSTRTRNRLRIRASAAGIHWVFASSSIAPKPSPPASAARARPWRAIPWPGTDTMGSQARCIVWLCIAGGAVFADALPPRDIEASRLPGVVDTRVRVVPYVADRVYRLVGAVGYAIHIELEPGERYRGLGAGDSEA